MIPRPLGKQEPIKRTMILGKLGRYGFPLVLALALAAGCERPPYEGPPETGATAANDASIKATDDAGLEPADGDFLISRFGAEPANLNPITSNDAGVVDSRGIDPLIIESLTEPDDETLATKPLVADHWDISQDHLTYTFYLRKDVKFSDGVPLTAHDVKFTFDKVMDPKVDAAPLRNYYKDGSSVTTVRGCMCVSSNELQFCLV